MYRPAAHSPACRRNCHFEGRQVELLGGSPPSPAVDGIMQECIVDWPPLRRVMCCQAPADPFDMIHLPPANGSGGGYSAGWLPLLPRAAPRPAHCEARLWFVCLLPSGLQCTAGERRPVASKGLVCCGVAVRDGHGCAVALTLSTPHMSTFNPRPLNPTALFTMHDGQGVLVETGI
jgi:hypothetical protein